MARDESPNKEEILKELQGIVGSQYASIEPSDRYAYSYDMTTPYVVPGIKDLGMDKAYFMPDYVVMPGSVEEVQAIVRLMNKYLIPMYGAGHMSNLASQHIPLEAGLMIDMHRMDRIIEVNEEMMSITVEAGVTNGRVRKAAEKRNLLYPCLEGPYSGTLVGHCVGANQPVYSGFGMDDRVITLEAVLPNGELLRTGSAAVIGQEDKNPYMRYALSPPIHGLYLRSMGTMGIVTKVTFRLLPRHEVEEQVHIGFDDLLSCVSFMRKYERRGIATYHLALNRPAIAHTAVPDVSLYTNPAEMEKHNALFPNWLDTIGLTGTAEQVELYKKYIREDAAEFKGRIMTFPGKVLEYVEQVCRGGSRMIIRGYTPSCIPIAVYTKFNQVVPVHELIQKVVRDCGLKDPFTGGPQTAPQLIVPSERGTVWYQDWDPWVDQEDPKKMRRVIAKSLYGALSSLEGQMQIHTPGVESMEMPGFVNFWKGIKKSVDPNLLFGRGRR